MSETTQEKCHLCGSPDHVWCGFCARCKEHTIGVRSCLWCEDACYPGESCPHGGPPHMPDPKSEALSLCCGASGYAYDYDPT